MNDWADYALAKLKKQEDDKRLKDEKFVATQKLLKSRGTPFWHEIRETVRQNVESLNTKAERKVLQLEITANSILRVSNVWDPSRGILHATFDEDTGKLEWDCGEKKGQWQLAVSDDGGVRFYSGMIPTTATSIAKQMLDALLFD